MSAELIDTAGRVETPEHISFEFRLAGPWRRLWAYGIDLVLRAVLMFAAVLLLGFMSVAFGAMEDFVGANAGLFLLFYFAIEWFYCVLFEWLWNGRTPGKKALGLRVVKEGGFPIGFQDSLIRNLLRGADMLPPIYGVPLPTYFVGALVSGADPKFRRLGDLAAGTIVIVEEPVKLRTPAQIEPAPRAEELAMVPPHPRLSVEERRTLDAFIRRFRTIHPARREELCEGWSRHLAHRLGAPRQASNARFLQLVYARLNEDARPVRRSVR